MSRQSLIRRAIQRILEPHLAKVGFAGTYPHFRRHEDEHLDLLSVEYDKWGGGFWLEFARHSPGPFETSWGETVAEDELNVAYISLEQRARLLANTTHEDLRERLFRYEDIAADAAKCESLVTSVVDLFPQVDAWLRDRKVGPNLSLYFS